MSKKEASLKSTFLKELRTWAESTSVVGPKAIYYTHMLPFMQTIWVITFAAAGSELESNAYTLFPAFVIR